MWDKGRQKERGKTESERNGSEEQFGRNRAVRVTVESRTGCLFRAMSRVGPKKSGGVLGVERAVSSAFCGGDPT